MRKTQLGRSFRWKTEGISSTLKTALVDLPSRAAYPDRALEYASGAAGFAFHRRDDGCDGGAGDDGGDGDVGIHQADVWLGK